MASFTTDSAGVHKDWVAAGATLEVWLGPFGDVFGQLIMPLDTTFLRGTWELSGNTVHLIPNADTFLGEMDWIAGKDRLSGDETFRAVRVRVVLKRFAAPAS